MSTETERRSFLGITVEGAIKYNKPQITQKPLSELEPLIRAVLADEFFASFGWHQYTPYFNDGEPCVFRVGEPWFRTVEDIRRADSGEHFDYDVEDDYTYNIGYSAHPTLGGRDRDWQTREVQDYVGEHETLYDACVALASAIESGAFESVLLEAFGDHAEITVTRDGITVDSYEHD